MLPEIHNTQPPMMPPPAIVVAESRASAGGKSIALPARIPTQCLERSASDYEINPMVLLAMLKVESNAAVGAIRKNTNGTYDLGPAQFNTGSWAARLEKEYGISRQAIMNDMCQAIRAMAYVVRVEIDRVGGDLWRGIGNYHSRTPAKHRAYVQRVFVAHNAILIQGKF